MAVDPALLADHGVLATAALGAGPGSTGGAQALAALADAPLAGGGTRRVADEAIDLFAGVGRAAAQAAETLELEGVQLDTLRGLRDALSGVSPEEELVKLTQFQRAHEAATRFVATVDEMLGDLIARV
jgi:flagellar hook-associated protein FlgK